MVSGDDRVRERERRVRNQGWTGDVRRWLERGGSWGERGRSAGRWV